MKDDWEYFRTCFRSQVICSLCKERTLHGHYRRGTTNLCVDCWQKKFDPETYAKRKADRLAATEPIDSKSPASSDIMLFKNYKAFTNIVPPTENP